MKWALIGFFVELYGIFILFGDFFGTILGFARNLPVVGPIIGMAVDRVGGGGQSLPVWIRGSQKLAVDVVKYERKYEHEEAVLCITA
jgi:hypothetical protein